MASMDAAEVLRVRAYIDAKKRAVEQAERAYDVQGATLALTELARPLTHASEFHPSWKRIVLDQFYQDVTKLVLTFVSVHLLPGFSPAQQAESFDVFFDNAHVPPLRSVSVLMAQIAASKPSSSNTTADEGIHVLTQCVRLLQRVLETGGVRSIVDQMLLEDSSTDGRPSRALLAAQPTIPSLCSVPDLVFNRLQRSTPAFFSPRSFHARLSQELLDGVLAVDAAASASVFRLFVDKLARIGHMDYLVRAWLARRDLYDPTCASAHARLVGALPVMAFEPFLQHLASTPPPMIESIRVVSSPQYRLLSLVPTDVWMNKQIQFVVAHKLLLAKPVTDLLFLRMLIESLGRGHEAHESPLGAVFDVVVNRWSGDTFPLTVDVGLNSSVVFFLRYAMKSMRRDEFEERVWTMKLCKGVQAHMAHSVERVRLLGMRVGESVSKVISPEHLLDFDIRDPDPVDEISRVEFDFTMPEDPIDNALEEEGDRQFQNANSEGAAAGRRTHKSTKMKRRGAALMDPDQVVDSDEDAESDSDASGSESDSDMSLEAYDLHDDETDLQAPRSVYIKDLLANLAEDDREKTEAALAEAESLLRRKPKDLHYSAQSVVQALFRLEDKYSTPNFTMLRAKALAAACALSPSGAVPYLQKQALEREQLLQSRLDVLEAMTAAAHELSETGAFRPNAPKNLLREDMETRTMDGLKTRRFGYRRDPLAPAKKNTFADHALAFFSPLLFGYVHYVKALEGSKRLSEVEDVFLAHLLHALSAFVECTGHAPPAVPMAKGLMAFAWHYRTNTAAAVRRQVLYAFSRALLVMPPFLLRQELGQNVIEMMAWLQQTRARDPDEGCREGARLLLSSGAVPMLTMP